MIYGNVLEKRQAQVTAIAELVQAFIANGGEVTIATPGRKSANTFASKGVVSNKGAKAMTLRNAGLYLR